MRVAVAQSHGFVGRHLVRVLQDAGHEAATLDAPDGAEALVLPAPPLPRHHDPARLERVVDQTRDAVALARRAGVPRFVLLSALGAMNEPAAPALRTRWLAEEMVRDSGLRWCVLRPGLVYGEGDQGLSQLPRLARDRGAVPLPAPGARRVQPLHVEDLALAVARCLADPGKDRRTHELAGPEQPRLDELVALVLAESGAVPSRRRAWPWRRAESPWSPEDAALLSLGDAVTRRDAVPRAFGFPARGIREGLAYLRPGGPHPTPFQAPAPAPAGPAPAAAPALSLRG